MGGLIRYFREARAELGRVTWPSRGVVWEGTQAVLLFVLMFTVLLYGMDWIFTFSLQQIGVLPAPKVSAK